jgi:hypothetical protein
VIRVLVLASHAGVITILAAAVGPTVAERSSRLFGSSFVPTASSRSAGSSRLGSSFDDLRGAAHLIEESCFILVICALVLASHAGVKNIPATTVGPAVAASRCSRLSSVPFFETRGAHGGERSSFFHFDVL